METFVIKKIETIEQHISLYLTRQVIWHYMKAREVAGVLVENFLPAFLHQGHLPIFLTSLQFYLLKVHLTKRLQHTSY